MKVTECLNAEHGVFLTQLSVLERMLRENSPAGELRSAMLAIGVAVERHRDSEEKILYPAIRREVGDDFPPLRVMETEHQEIERCIEQAASGKGDVRDPVRTFVDVLRQHISKEMHILFPMAEERIPDTDLERMARECSQDPPL